MEKKSIYKENEDNKDLYLNENILNNQKVQDLLQERSRLSTPIIPEANQNNETPSQKDILSHHIEINITPIDPNPDGKVMSSEMFSQLIRINKLNAYSMIKNKLEAERLKSIEINNNKAMLKMIDGRNSTQEDINLNYLIQNITLFLAKNC